MFTTRRLRWYFAMPGVALATVALVAAARPIQPLCKMAAEWVQAHRAALPANLVAYRTFKPAYQLAMYPSLSPEVRTALWREHWQSFLDDKSQLSDAQRVFLRVAIAHSADYFGDQTAGILAEARDSLQTRAAALFDKHLDGLIFYKLGYTGPENGFKASASASAIRHASMLAPAAFILRDLGERLRVIHPSPYQSDKGALQDFCDCDLQGDYCIWGACQTPGGGCTPVIIGCGFTGYGQCNGACF